MKKIIKRVNFFIEPEVWKQFKKLTKRNGDEMTKVLMAAIREYVEKGGKS